MASGSIRIIIADDHPVARAGVRLALETAGGFDLLAEATDGKSAIAAVRTNRPQLLIVDVAMPGTTGIEVIEEVRRWSPDTRIFVLTGISAPGLLSHAKAAGAAGMAIKSEDPELWVPVLRRSLAPGFHASPLAERMLSRIRAPHMLSRRERQVLLAISRGDTSAAIAERLGISVKTVDKHRTSVMRKLGAHSVAGLLGAALRDGLLSSIGRS
jgi:DNA-binding NarL/FixJ family response regulator